MRKLNMWIRCSITFDLDLVCYLLDVEGANSQIYSAFWLQFHTTFFILNFFKFKCSDWPFPHLLTNNRSHFSGRRWCHGLRPRRQRPRAHPPLLQRRPVGQGDQEEPRQRRGGHLWEQPRDLSFQASALRTTRRDPRGPPPVVVLPVCLGACHTRWVLSFYGLICLWHHLIIVSCPPGSITTKQTAIIKSSNDWLHLTLQIIWNIHHHSSLSQNGCLLLFFCLFFFALLIWQWKYNRSPHSLWLKTKWDTTVSLIVT